MDPDNQQGGLGAEAHQDIAHVPLSEAECRALRGVGVTEHAIHSSPVRLGYLLFRNV